MRQSHRSHQLNVHTLLQKSTSHQTFGYNVDVLANGLGNVTPVLNFLFVSVNMLGPTEQAIPERPRFEEGSLSLKKDIFPAFIAIQLEVDLQMKCIRG